ncbi:hypothetical protein [Mesorhizobium sp. L48C026A00]|uniref:hypothetical protein n=1 Tax=Mesorhizobium sp. L48C026A00 TaxID=1287182 RepID=UPI001FD985D9|nr:hypothetical protein [Mesorhizobium sp. L48C026A00]
MPAHHVFDGRGFLGLIGVLNLAHDLLVRRDVTFGRELLQRCQAATTAVDVKCLIDGVNKQVVLQTMVSMLA